MAADGIGCPELSDRDSEFFGNGVQGVAASHPVPPVGRDRSRRFGGGRLPFGCCRCSDGYLQPLTRKNAGPFQPVGPPYFSHRGPEPPGNGNQRITPPDAIDPWLGCRGLRRRGRSLGFGLG